MTMAGDRPSGSKQAKKTSKPTAPTAGFVRRSSKKGTHSAKKSSKSSSARKANPTNPPSSGPEPDPPTVNQEDDGKTAQPLALLEEGIEYIRANPQQDASLKRPRFNVPDGQHEDGRYTRSSKKKQKGSFSRRTANHAAQPGLMRGHDSGQRADAGCSCCIL